jgi:hypothetical protein
MADNYFKHLTLDQFFKDFLYIFMLFSIKLECFYSRVKSSFGEFMFIFTGKVIMEMSGAVTALALAPWAP